MFISAMKTAPRLSCLIFPFLLQACSPAPAPEQPALPAEAVAEVAAPLAQRDAGITAAPVFATDVTMRDIMTRQIDIHARALWGAVSYVVTEEGVEETLPRSEEDWQRLRGHALALIEGGSALMMPGRTVDTPENAAAYPDFQFTPDEIAQLVRADLASWAYNLQAMQAATRLTLEAIDRRDLLAFTEQSALINGACEACHAQYWYRPLPMRGQEGIR